MPSVARITLTLHFRVGRNVKSKLWLATAANPTIRTRRCLGAWQSCPRKLPRFCLRLRVNVATRRRPETTAALPKPRLWRAKPLPDTPPSVAQGIACLARTSQARARSSRAKATDDSAPAIRLRITAAVRARSEAGCTVASNSARQPSTT